MSITLLLAMDKIRLFGKDFHELFTVIFGLASLAHVFEGIYAYSIAKEDNIKWFIQTTFIGFPSLILLNKINKK
jgi:hypothetical protein